MEDEPCGFIFSEGRSGSHVFSALFVVNGHSEHNYSIVLIIQCSLVFVNAVRLPDYS